MSGPRLKTPLLFLPLLLSSLTGTAFCEDVLESDADTSLTTQAHHINNNGNNDISDYSPVSDPSTITPTTPSYETTDDSGSGEPSTLLVSDSNNLTDSGEEAEDLNIPLILIPVILAVIIVGVIICAAVIVRRCSQKAGNHESSKEDPHLEGSSTEKVPMPMFEEDVPSVLELEMDELDQWMKKDS